MRAFTADSDNDIVKMYPTAFSWAITAVWEGFEAFDNGLVVATSQVHPEPRGCGRLKKDDVELRR